MGSTTEQRGQRKETVNLDRITETTQPENRKKIHWKKMNGATETCGLLKKKI